MSVSKFYNLGKKGTSTGNIAAGVLYEALTSAKLIHGFGRQKQTVKHYDNSFFDHIKVTIKAQILSATVARLFVPLGQTAALITLYRAFFTGMPLGDMALVLFAFARLLPLWTDILTSKTEIETFLPAFEQIKNLNNKAQNIKPNF